MAKVVTIIALTDSAYVAIAAHSFARKVSLQEDESGPPAGITIEWPNGTVAEYSPSQQPVVIENPGGGGGPFMGVPAYGDASSYAGCQSNATQYCQVKSVGATSKLQLIEDN